MTSAVLVGGTGLVGSHILSVLSSHPSISELHAFARRDLPSTSPKLKPLISTGTSTWPSLYPKASPIFFSALGTTKAAAGSLANQRKIDHDLNLDLAKAAKENGAKTYVLVSTAGANTSSMLPYPRMKGELEEAVKGLGFEHTIILRPGLLVGERQESRPAEFAIRKIATVMGKLSEPWLKDFWAQDAHVVAKAAVSAGLQTLDGKTTEKVWIMNQSDIVRLGKTEWQA